MLRPPANAAALLRAGISDASRPRRRMLTRPMKGVSCFPAIDSEISAGEFNYENYPFSLMKIRTLFVLDYNCTSLHAREISRRRASSSTGADRQAQMALRGPVHRRASGYRDWCSGKQESLLRRNGGRRRLEELGRLPNGKTSLTGSCPGPVPVSAR